MKKNYLPMKGMTAAGRAFKMNMKRHYLIASVFISAGVFGQNSVREMGGNNMPVFIQNPQTSGSCSYQQVGNNLENGYASYYLGNTISYQEADAFDVPANEVWQIQGIRSNFFKNGTPTGHWIRLLTDVGNTPGPEIAFLTTNNLTSTIIGNNYGFDLHEITVMLPSPWTLSGGTSGSRYWLVNMDESSSMTYWESRSDYNYNNTYGFQAVGNSGPWTINTSVTSHVFEILYNTLDSVQTSICKGDSIQLGGGYVSVAGYYTDTLLNINGCDSLVVTALSIDSVIVTLNAFQNDTVCSDDSLVPLPTGSPAGGTYSGTGVSGNFFDPASSGPGLFTIYYAYTDSVTGCTSSDSTQIFVDSVLVSLSAFSPDSVCDNGGLVALPQASPAGGVYSGNGVSGTDFDPMAAGLGFSTVYYTYTDSVTLCTGTDSTLIFVKNCTGTDEWNISRAVRVYPVPVKEKLYVHIRQDALSAVRSLRLTNITGEELLRIQTGNQSVIAIDMRSFSPGAYLLYMETEAGNIIKKVIR